MSSRRVVIGSRGLLGSALCRRLEDDGVVFDRLFLEWSNPEAARRDVQAWVEHRQESEHLDVYWAAGVGSMGSTGTALAAEYFVLEGLLDGLQKHCFGGGSAGLFYPSSACGVFAGSTCAPFSESDCPRPTSAYGRHKLDSERLLLSRGRTAGLGVCVGRVATLYGPGQNLQKPQGLVSKMCLSSLTGSPVSLYVHPKTKRDYLYVDDCARIAVGMMGLLDRDEGQSVLKIICSGVGTTIEELKRVVETVSGAEVRLEWVESEKTAFQPRDLTFVSSEFPVLDYCRPTRLLDGVSLTLASIRNSLLRDAR